MFWSFPSAWLYLGSAVLSAACRRRRLFSPAARTGSSSKLSSHSGHRWPRARVRSWPLWSSNAQSSASRDIWASDFCRERSVVRPGRTTPTTTRSKIPMGLSRSRKLRWTLFHFVNFCGNQLYHPLAVVVAYMVEHQAANVKSLSANWDQWAFPLALLQFSRGPVSAGCRAFYRWTLSYRCPNESFHSAFGSDGCNPMHLGPETQKNGYRLMNMANPCPSKRRTYTSPPSFWTFYCVF